MKFDKDIVADLKGENSSTNSAPFHYHDWSDQSIKFFWDIWANNSALQKQFYPIEYWKDLLAWADSKLQNKPLVITDVGCGNGNLIDCIRKLYPKASIHGVDIAEELFEPAKYRFTKDDTITFRVGSLEQLPFPDNSLDLVTCTEVLEHTFPKTFTNSFCEVRRVLKDGGHYLASVPFDEKVSFVCCPECGSVFTPYQHMIFEISRDDILDLLSKNGLELVGWYHSLDRSVPKNPVKKLAKSILIKGMPGFANRVFPKAGVSGFLSRAYG